MGNGERLTVQLSGGAPWGFRLFGGDEEPLIVAKLRKRSKASEAGLAEDDVILAINGKICRGMNHPDAMSLVDAAKDSLLLQVLRGPNNNTSDINAAYDAVVQHLIRPSQPKPSTGLPFMAERKHSNVSDTNAPRAHVTSVVPSQPFGYMAKPGEVKSTVKRESVTSGGFTKDVTTEQTTQKFGGTEVTRVRRETTIQSTGPTFSAVQPTSPAQAPPFTRTPIQNALQFSQVPTRPTSSVPQFSPKPFTQQNGTPFSPTSLQSPPSTAQPQSPTSVPQFTPKSLGTSAPKPAIWSPSKAPQQQQQQQQQYQQHQQQQRQFVQNQQQTHFARSPVTQPMQPQFPRPARPHAQSTPAWSPSNQQRSPTQPNVWSPPAKSPQVYQNPVKSPQVYQHPVKPQQQQNFQRPQQQFQRPQQRQQQPYGQPQHQQQPYQQQHQQQQQFQARQNELNVRPPTKPGVWVPPSKQPEHERVIRKSPSPIDFPQKKFTVEDDHEKFDRPPIWGPRAVFAVNANQPQEPQVSSPAKSPGQEVQNNVSLQTNADRSITMTIGFPTEQQQQPPPPQQQNQFQQQLQQQLQQRQQKQQQQQPQQQQQQSNDVNKENIRPLANIPKYKIPGDATGKRGVWQPSIKPDEPPPRYADPDLDKPEPLPEIVFNIEKAPVTVTDDKDKLPPLAPEISRILNLDGAESDVSTPDSGGSKSNLRTAGQEKVFSDSAFYADAGHTFPTVEEQMKMAKRVAVSLLAPANEKAKGYQMFMKRKRKSEKWTTTGVHIDISSSGGDLANINDFDEFEDPNRPLFTFRVPKLTARAPETEPPTEKKKLTKQDLENVRLHEKKNMHNTVAPQVCFSIAEALHNTKGRGGKIFAKRRAKSESWVVDESNVKSPPVLVPLPATIPTNRLQDQIEANKSKLTPWDAALEDPTGDVDAAFGHLRTKTEVFSSIQEAALQKQKTMGPPSWMKDPGQPIPVAHYPATSLEAQQANMAQYRDFNTRIKGWGVGVTAGGEYQQRRRPAAQPRFLSRSASCTSAHAPQSPLPDHTGGSTSPRCLSSDFNIKPRGWGRGPPSAHCDRPVSPTFSDSEEFNFRRVTFLKDSHATPSVGVFDARQALSSVDQASNRISSRFNPGIKAPVPGTASTDLLLQRYNVKSSGQNIMQTVDSQKITHEVRESSESETISVTVKQSLLVDSSKDFKSEKVSINEKQSLLADSSAEVFIKKDEVVTSPSDEQVVKIEENVATEASVEITTDNNANVETKPSIETTVQTSSSSEIKDEPVSTTTTTTKSDENISNTAESVEETLSISTTVTKEEVAIADAPEDTQVDLTLTLGSDVITMETPSDDVTAVLVAGFETDNGGGADEMFSDM